jgi:hypothetical protein
LGSAREKAIREGRSKKAAARRKREYSKNIRGRKK